MYQFDSFSGFGQELQAGRTKSMQAPKLKLLHWAAVSRVEALTLRHSPANHLDSAHEEAPCVYEFLAGTAAVYSQDTVAHIFVLAFYKGLSYNPCRLDIFCFSFFLHFQANCASKSNGGGGQDRDFSSASSPTNKTVEFRSGAIWSWFPKSWTPKISKQFQVVSIHGQNHQISLPHCTTPSDMRPTALLLDPSQPPFRPATGETPQTHVECAPHHKKANNTHHQHSNQTTCPAHAVVVFSAANSERHQTPLKWASQVKFDKSFNCW